jgi:hypothetical protein
MRLNDLPRPYHPLGLRLALLLVYSHLGVGKHRRILRVRLSQQRRRGISRPVVSEAVVKYASLSHPARL